MANILISAVSARRGGGLTYLRNIVRTFPRGSGSKLFILAPVPIDGLPAHPDVEWVRAPRWSRNPILRFLLGSIYFRYIWRRRKDFDAVYYAGGSFDVALPAGAKTIVAFRNMLPFDREARRRYPLGWMRLRNWLLQIVQGRAFRKADLVIFISNYARQVIDARIGARKGRSEVIPHGASRTSAPLSSAIASKLPTGFVLYLSILDVYKGQLELVEAWAKLRQLRPDLTEKLVLAGPEYGPYAWRVRRAVEQFGLQEDVILTGAVPHEQISDLASRAELNLFMSSCENCPNILLELMLVGRPLLVSDRQPMPELGGPELAYVDPADPDAIASAMASLLGNAERSARIAEAAAQRSKLYRWERNGEATWKAILGCANPPEPRSAVSATSNKQATNVQG